MEKTIYQFRTVGYNVIAWALIWFIAVLAIPAGLFILLIYAIRGIADKVIRKSGEKKQTILKESV